MVGILKPRIAAIDVSFRSSTAEAQMLQMGAWGHRQSGVCERFSSMGQVMLAKIEEAEVGGDSRGSRTAHQIFEGTEFAQMLQAAG